MTCLVVLSLSPHHPLSKQSMLKQHPIINLRQSSAEPVYQVPVDVLRGGPGRKTYTQASIPWYLVTTPSISLFNSSFLALEHQLPSTDPVAMLFHSAMLRPNASSTAQ